MSFLGTIGSDSDVVTIGIQRWLMALCLAIIWLIELIAEQNGARTVSILLIEHERSNFTVVLNCMADETKLLHYQRLYPSGKIKRPSYSLVTSWIKLLIRRSIKYCGISNAINGTEDGLIFDFNKVVERINNTGRGIEENVEDDDRENEGDNDNSESEPENGYYEENDST
ncbi:hypothetical protein RhiirA5_406313 [Rhizophagus irregularis]|uniref:Uncharacterized protein n=1 Tax=Rhizophagus irregularis TaxID=588596 RepID=A0A2N0QD88_9GLOM|nr:hypothetical protein RhiirA5_406313 [Rhizophagus irregularis]